jgi:hypothetical protein
MLIHTDPAGHSPLAELHASTSATRPRRTCDASLRARRRWPALLVFPALLVASALAASPVAAAPDPAASEEELINRGIALREARNDAAALDAFRQAYNLKQDARALAQVALAEQALGRWVDAEADLTKAISRADDAWIQRNQVLLRQALAEIQGHLGTLELTGGVPGAEVLVNGIIAGTLPLTKPLRVNAGKVTLEVRAASYLPSAHTVTIPRQGTARETVALVPAALAATPSTSVGRSDPDEKPGWRPRTKVGLAVGAAAVVSAAVGTTFLFVRESRANDFNDAGCGTAALTARCTSSRDDEKSAVTWAVTGLVGAAVLGGVSAYLLLWPSTPGPASVAQSGTFSSFLRCTPAPGGGMSLTCGGRF